MLCTRRIGREKNCEEKKTDFCLPAACAPQRCPWLHVWREVVQLCNNILSVFVFISTGQRALSRTTCVVNVVHPHWLVGWLGLCRSCGKDHTTEQFLIYYIIIINYYVTALLIVIILKCRPEWSGVILPRWLTEDPANRSELRLIFNVALHVERVMCDCNATRVAFENVIRSTRAKFCSPSRADAHACSLI
jgi:hypothetical protein